MLPKYRRRRILEMVVEQEGKYLTISNSYLNLFIGWWS